MRLTIPALLLASSLLPVTALAAPPASADVHNAAVRVSTGVVSPRVLNAQQFPITADGVQAAEPLGWRTVVLDLNVDEKGMPSEVHVVRSVNPKVDAQVLAAARQFRFQPALLDDQPVPVDLRLSIVLQR